MGKKFSTALMVIGVVLVAAAIVWWAIIAPMLVKLPNDIDSAMDFEGNRTVYVNPSTGAPLPAGQEMELPVTAVRTVKALPDLYTSGTAVLEDSLVLTTAGTTSDPQLFHYALDRKDRKCVDSTENWAYSPQLALDRTGNYGILFPAGLKVGDTVPVYVNDPSKAFDFTVKGKIADWNGLGITVLEIDGTRASTDYNPAIAQAVLGTGQGLPMEITFEQFAAQLKAKGLDLQALLAGLATVASAEDMQSLGALTQQPVKLTYKQESGDVYFIEQKTGSTVGATFDRTTTMSVDTTGLLGAFAILAKYASDATVGPAITAAMQAATQLGEAEASKIYNLTMSITDASQATLADSAKEKIPLMTLVNLWIPLIIVVLGGLVLILGTVGLMMKSRKAAA